MPLHLDHRPTKIDEIVGKENAKLVESLHSLMARRDGDHPHSYLLTGPSGCGKTTIARILADHYGCNGMNLKEVDSADFRGVDTIREIRRLAGLRPVAGAPARGFILDECHQLTKDAQEALLKVLEDTPKHVYFFLCTTEEDKLKTTLRNRCTQYTVRPLGETEMMQFLRRMCLKIEKKPPPVPVLEAIQRDSLGSPRAALVVLDQIIDLEPDKMLDVATRAAAEHNEIIDLCRLLVRGAPWADVAGVLAGLNRNEAEKVRMTVLSYCTTVMLGARDETARSLLTRARCALILDAFREPMWNAGFAGVLLASYEVVRED